MKTLRVNTRAKNDMVDITASLKAFVEASGLREGACLVFVPHTTAGITVNENADPDVQRDMQLGLERMIPDEDYRHFEHNSPAHMLSSLVGCSRPLVVSRGQIVLGKWQAVYLCEFDGPKTRQVHLQLIPGIHESGDETFPRSQKPL